MQLTVVKSSEERLAKLHRNVGDNQTVYTGTTTGYFIDPVVALYVLSVHFAQFSTIQKSTPEISS